MENLIKILELNIADCVAQLAREQSEKDRQIMTVQLNTYREIRQFVQYEQDGTLAEYNESYEDTLRRYGFVK